MVNKFDTAFIALLNAEGGYSNDKEDPGGKTKFGITLKEFTIWRFRLNFPGDIKDLTIDDVEVYYKTVWWDKYHYESISSPTIAAKIFNLAVNMGPKQAHKIVQNALVCIGYELKIDGILGDKSIRLINECILIGREPILLNQIKEGAANFYIKLTKKKEILKKFLKGWLIRAKD